MSPTQRRPRFFSRRCKSHPWAFGGSWISLSKDTQHLLFLWTMWKQYQKGNWRHPQVSISRWWWSNTSFGQTLPSIQGVCWWFHCPLQVLRLHRELPRLWGGAVGFWESPGPYAAFWADTCSYLKVYRIQGGCVYRVYHRACLKFLRASGQIYESQF